MLSQASGQGIKEHNGKKHHKKDKHKKHKKHKKDKKDKEKGAKKHKKSKKHRDRRGSQGSQDAGRDEGKSPIDGFDKSEIVDGSSSTDPTQVDFAKSGKRVGGVGQCDDGGSSTGGPGHSPMGKGKGRDDNESSQEILLFD